MSHLRTETTQTAFTLPLPSGNTLKITCYEGVPQEDLELIARMLAGVQELQPIETAPWDAEVLLTGPSGYSAPHDRFYINGYRVRDWHQGQWNDATGTRLSECGWTPTHWMNLPKQGEQ